MGPISRIFLILLLSCATAQVRAADWAYQPLGWGGFVTNDRLGDGQDRWRTGSYTLSVVVGPQGVTQTPARAGRLIELRFHAEGIAPVSIANPAPDDRRFAGILSFGGHTHFTAMGGEVRAGADLVWTGPSTGSDRVQ